MNNNYAKLILTILIATSNGCSKMIAIDQPSNQIISESVFNNDNSANSAMAGIYTQIISSNYFFYSLLPSLSSDELKNLTLDPQYISYYTNTIKVDDIYVGAIWSLSYKLIYQINSLLEGTLKSNSLSAKAKLQLLGEGKFLRSLIYFELVNLYGDVPLLLTTNVNETAKATRSQTTEIYKQIISDLIESKNNLSYEYVGADRCRANKSCAISLLSRVYLYQKDYINSETQATIIINDSLSYPIETNLDNTYLKDSKETIFQIETPNGYTSLGQLFIPSTSQPNFVLTNYLLKDIDSNDLRKKSWIKSINTFSNVYYYPYKYKNTKSNATNKENVVILRSSELFLIRAECRIYQNDISGGLSDLNKIRSKAGLDPISILDKDKVLAYIKKERRIEFFTEWGQRWFDLKRTNSIDSTLSPIKPTWTIDKSLYPIPSLEILANNNLIQNKGY